MIHSLNWILGYPAEGRRKTSWLSNHLIYEEGEMSVPEDLIKILIYHGFIRREHAVAFHRYVDKGKEEITSNIDLLPTTHEEIRLEKTLLVRAQSYSIFFKIFLGLDRFLKKRLTEEEYARAMGNYKKSIPHVVVNLPPTRLKKRR